MLSDCVQNPGPELLRRCLESADSLWTPGMSDAMFLLLVRGKIHAVAQQESILYAQQHVPLMYEHIRRTLCRCLPPCIVTDKMVESCFLALEHSAAELDPMHTGAIHAFAGAMLLNEAHSTHPLLRKLQRSAQRLLPKGQAAGRDDLRLVTLDALYNPHLLPPGPHTSYINLRLGLKDGIPRSCEEIAAYTHRPLTYVRELEAAVINTLIARSSGGSHA